MAVSPWPLQFLRAPCLCDTSRTTSLWYLVWSQVFVCSQCPQGSGADVTLLLACSRATLLMPVSPQYVTWCPYCPGARATFPALPPPRCMAAATPLHPCAHATPVSLVPADPSVRHCHLSPQCAPTAAPGTCTRCGALPAAWPRPPSACSPPSWCWCWVSDPPCWGQPPVSPPAETCRQGQPLPGEAVGTVLGGDTRH